MYPSGQAGQFYNDNNGIFLILGCSGVGAPIGSQVPNYSVPFNTIGDFSGAQGTVVIPGGGQAAYAMTVPQTITFTMDNGTSAQVFRVTALTQGASCAFVVQH